MNSPLALILLALLTANGAAPVEQAGRKPLSDAAPPPVASTLTLGSASGRMTVPVSIGQSGPFDFIIDTGAERSVVSRELASSLGLAAGQPVRVTGLAGNTAVQTVIVPGLSVSTLDPTAMEAPALTSVNLGANGMLGIDALQGHRIAIDFNKNHMTVAPATRKLRGVLRPGDIVVQAKNVYGQLIVTDARYQGQRISVIIDTGSPITIGNLAMLKLTKHAARPLGPISVLSVTGQSLNADYVSVDDVQIGGVGFKDVPMAFADAAPFARFGLQDTPALMLGMSTLRLFRRVDIDFANREISFSLPRGTLETKMCGNGQILCSRFE